MTHEHQRVSFSQFGEDGVLAWLFHGSRDGFYIDVGCHHPFRFSNTALLFLYHNWRGLNIDVDERAISAFNVSRPNDINVLCGVAGEEGEMDVTMFEEGAINSFSEASANHPAWAHIPRVKKRVKVMPLASILDTFLPKGQIVDYMNIDAEGLDYIVLSSNDWERNLPSVISVESDDLDLQEVQSCKTYTLLRDRGYKLISHVAVTSFYRRD